MGPRAPSCFGKCPPGSNAIANQFAGDRRDRRCSDQSPSLQREQAPAQPTARHQHNRRGHRDPAGVREAGVGSGQSGNSPVTWARYVREAPFPGLYPKSVIYQFAKADQQAINPGTTAILRAGNLADRTLHYRHDLAFAEDPAIPKNPHPTLLQVDAPERAFSRDRPRLTGPDRQLLRLLRHGRHSSGTGTLFRGASRGSASRKPELHPVAPEDRSLRGSLRSTAVVSTRAGLSTLGRCFQMCGRKF